jgi:hypothetical protein
VTPCSFQQRPASSIGDRRVVLSTLYLLAASSAQQPTLLLMACSCCCRKAKIRERFRTKQWERGFFKSPVVLYLPRSLCGKTSAQEGPTPNYLPDRRHPLLSSTPSDESQWFLPFFQAEQPTMLNGYTLERHGVWRESIGKKDEPGSLRIFAAASWGVTNGTKEAFSSFGNTQQNQPTY